MATTAAELKKQTADQAGTELLRWKTRLAMLWLAHMVSFASYLILTSLEPGVITAGQKARDQMANSRAGIELIFFIPLVMVWLSMTLKDTANRWTNFVLGILFALLLITTLISSYTTGATSTLLFNILTGCVVSLLTVWYAWKWPRQKA